MLNPTWSWQLLVWLSGVLLLSACGREPSPQYQVRDFYASLGAQSPAALQHVYEDLLSGETKAALDLRAKQLEEVTSTPVQPWDVFVFRGLLRGDRVGQPEVVEEADGRAKVRVNFKWYVPGDGEKAKRPPPEPITVELVHEDGQWRIHLPGLVSNGGS